MSSPTLSRKKLSNFGFLLLFANVLASCSGASVQTQRIAIVGGGFSGLSAAHHLIEAGYSDITIFESSYRAGGFVSSVLYKNVTHDMSTYALTDIYWRFRATMETLGATFCPLSGFAITPRSKNKPAAAVPVEVFSPALTAQTLEDPTTFPEKFQEQLTRYIMLWSELFELPFLNPSLHTERLFPSRPPSDPVKRRKLATPMTQLLREEGLDLLIPNFRIRLNTQAYGPLDTTAAVYAMSWLAPATLLPTSQSSFPCGEHDSFQALADLLVESFAGKAKLRFGTPVRAVNRGEKFVTVVSSDGEERFDRVIVTRKLPKTRDGSFLVRPVLRRERLLAKRAESLEIYTVLLEGLRKNVIGKSRVSSFDGPAVSGSATKENFFITLTQEAQVDGGPFHDDPKTVVRGAALIFYEERAKSKPVRLSGNVKDRMVLSRLRLWDKTKWTVLQGRSFRKYFQRWVPKDVQRGFPWKPNRLQGKGRVYLVSAHACGFESVAHVFDCAKHLVDKHF